ncbi:hypothetical protein LE181_08995 [Streptomyces sp. SCA3-4]|uniref:hypothetical protein n=1 Tax=Streptomyces sichuanensis TaxID=2871810 RepID=UPI001CE2E4DE|nr:hypothetical protein [Streptomyces sichuanensis]MCA6092296.1 hypothetical protein [Streptomyces sichuanensis]
MHSIKRLPVGITRSGGIFTINRVRVSAAGEWTSGGNPAVSVRISSALDAPRLSHSAASGSNSAQSAADSARRASARPSAASASYASERAGDGAAAASCSGVMSPVRKRDHHASSRAVREKYVRNTHCVRSSLTGSRTRRRWPACDRAFRAVRRACWPYGSSLASVFTSIAAPSGRRSRYEAMYASRAGRCANVPGLRGAWPGAVRFP